MRLWLVDTVKRIQDTSEKTEKEEEMQKQSLRMRFNYCKAKRILQLAGDS